MPQRDRSRSGAHRRRRTPSRVRSKDRRLIGGKEKPRARRGISSYVPALPELSVGVLLHPREGRCCGAASPGSSVRDLAADDVAIERQGLEHDIEAATVLVREREADVEPVVVLALASDD